MNQFEKAYLEKCRLVARMGNAKTEEERDEAQREYDGFITDLEEAVTVEDIAYREVWVNYNESRNNGSNILVFQGSTGRQDLLVQVMRAEDIRMFALAGNPELLEDAIKFIKSGCRIIGARKVVTFKTAHGKETRKPALLFRIL